LSLEKLQTTGVVLLDLFDSLLRYQTLKRIRTDFETLQREIDVGVAARHTYSALDTASAMALVRALEELLLSLFEQFLNGRRRRRQQPYVSQVPGNIVFINAPVNGETNQVVHRDQWSLGLTVLIPLVAINAHNGCTEVCLRSSRKGPTAFFANPSDVVQLFLRAGQLALFDCRLLHRGTPNTTTVDRPVLSFAVWAKEAGEHEQTSQWPVYSLLKNER